MPTIDFYGFEATALFHLAANPTVENLESTLKGLTSREAHEVARAIVDPRFKCAPPVRETANLLLKLAGRTV